MSTTPRLTQRILSYLLLCSLILSLARSTSASAQGRDGLQREVNPQTGKINFIHSEDGRPVAAAQALGFVPDVAADPAFTIAQHFGHEFGLSDATHHLSMLHTNHAEHGRLSVHYQQNYQGIPVMG